MVSADKVDGADLRKARRELFHRLKVALVGDKVAGKRDYIGRKLPDLIDKLRAVFAELSAVQVGKLHYRKAVNALR